MDARNRGAAFAAPTGSWCFGLLTGFLRRWGECQIADHETLRLLDALQLQGAALGDLVTPSINPFFQGQAEWDVARLAVPAQVIVFADCFFWGHEYFRLAGGTCFTISTKLNPS